MVDRKAELASELPLVSVIIPVYGGEKYIHECISSVLGQTYKNIECILVDGTSPDKCPQICDEYAASDKRVKVLHKKDRGLSDDRNAGYRLSAGEYITFVDVDDVLSPDMIQTLYKLCVKYKVRLAQCNHTVKRVELDVVRNEQIYGILLKKERCMTELLGNHCIAFCVTWGKLMHKSLMEKILFPCGAMHEDVYTSHLFFEAAENMVYTTKRLYYYRQREDSLMAQIRRGPDLSKLTANLSRAEYFCSHKYYDALEKQVNVCLEMIRKNYCEYHNDWTAEQKKYMLSEYRKLIKKLITVCRKSIPAKVILFGLSPNAYYFIVK